MHDDSDREWRVRSPVVDYLPFLKYKGVVNIIKTDVEIELDNNYGDVIGCGDYCSKIYLF